MTFITRALYKHRVINFSDPDELVRKEKFWYPIMSQDCWLKRCENCYTNEIVYNEFEAHEEVGYSSRNKCENKKESEPYG